MAIKAFCDSKLNPQMVAALSALVTDRTWTAGSYLCEANVTADAALYLVRKGSVVVTTSENISKTVGPGGYFGEDQLLVDVGLTATDTYILGAAVTVAPPYTVIACGDSDVTCGVLTVAACRTVFDTRRMGQSILDDSIKERPVPLSSLERHTVLGAGTFGMVFLVSRKNSVGERFAYALKVQAKYELVRDGQAKAVVDEKNIMASLHHPFLIGLVNTYHDKDFLYLLLQLVQGGELYTYIHTPKKDFLPESAARFYAACIAEGLG